MAVHTVRPSPVEFEPADRAADRGSGRPAFARAASEKPGPLSATAISTYWPAARASTTTSEPGGA